MPILSWAGPFKHCRYIYKTCIYNHSAWRTVFRIIRPNITSLTHDHEAPRRYRHWPIGPCKHIKKHKYIFWNFLDQRNNCAGLTIHRSDNDKSSTGSTLHTTSKCVAHHPIVLFIKICSWFPRLFDAYLTKQVESIRRTIYSGWISCAVTVFL